MTSFGAIRDQPRLPALKIVALNRGSLRTRQADATSFQTGSYCANCWIRREERGECKSGAEKTASTVEALAVGNKGEPSRGRDPRSGPEAALRA